HSLFLGIVALYCLFFFTDPASTDIYTLSLHDALPISTTFCGAPLGRHRGHSRQDDHDRADRLGADVRRSRSDDVRGRHRAKFRRSEEHTSELQSPYDLVCRLLLEKKKIRQQTTARHSS